ncbi:MAG: hydrolase [Cereibacter sphaeroides]|uniref:Hydrolase n=1 Tax=Cereibacter sphaeroides TaxID=1063 RepID=A0A2W5TY07_CERSP|nr:MAG: hydrolase [Cereibacter sphaeroides]
MTRPVLPNKCHHVVARPGCSCCSAEVRAINRRLGQDLTRRGFIAGSSASVALLGLSAYSGAKAQTAAVPPVLFTNARLFDGLELNTREGVSVLVQGGMIAEVAQGAVAPPDGATVIDAAGRTLMPGLIDAHWHTMLCGLPVAQLMTADAGDIHLAAAAQAERTLMRGFTTIRDLGGPSFPLKRAIDAGAVKGPRIYPSGAMISQTSGHGDFRLIWELPGSQGNLSRSDALMATALADGRDAVLRATREQLMQGASQIKIVAGGGASSFYDPIDVTQFLPEEVEAAVLAAEDWGTYVAAHVYTPRGIQRCLTAGVKCIEHGQLADEDSVKMMADRNVVWSIQPFVQALANPNLPESVIAKQRLLWEGTDQAYELAIKHKIPTGWGSDILFDAAATATQGRNLAYMTRWYTPAQALKLATADNAFILGMSGLRNPYPGALGIIANGAHADMLLVEGDPTADLSLVADPEKNFRVIMKAGQIYKNTL